MLEVKGLVKKYGDKTAINGLSFQVAKGEVVGLLGLNGAGKSTTMNCITGYIAPTAGSVTVDGHDLLKEPDKAKRVIGYLPEVFSFYPDMKVYEYLNFVCDLKGVFRNQRQRREHILAVCGRVGLSELTGRMIRNLSKGYKQRVGFAQALIGNPGVLILDEPTVGLDPSQIIEIRQLIRESGKESTIIVSSHILSEIQAICSRIIVIHDGQIAADGPTEQVIREAAGRAELVIRAKGPETRIEKVLSEIPGSPRFVRLPEAEEGTSEYQLTGNGQEDLREAVFQAFAASGLVLLQICSREASLEHTFLHLTGQDSKEAEAAFGKGEQ
ncbi:MAG: ABC transporter ATP-binding protein [Parasporobacterium sp.]|nr:ABC transporter ATP-binding protein [Parasporobacterium sp.]